MVERINKKAEPVVVETDQNVIFDPSEVRLSEQKTLKTKQNRPFPIWAKAWLALTPALIFLVFFTFYPIINTFLYSFIGANIHEGDTTSFGTIFISDNAGSFALSQFFASLSKWNQYIKDPANYPGMTNPVEPVLTLKNYQIVLTSDMFLNSLLNTFLLVIISVPLTIMIALLIAVFLNSIKTLRGFFQTIFFLPYVTNSIALGMVFNAMFSYHDNGLMNVFLSWFGVPARNWLDLRIDAGSVVIPAATRTAMFIAITIYTVWNGLAFKILVFMSGLASIDKQYYDAARIDGSSRFTIFRRITVPLLSPQIFYITITSFIGAFKSYTGVISLFADGTANNGVGSFGGGDQREWMTMVGYIYYSMGTSSALLPSVASAGSIILLIIILLITLVQLQVSKRRVHY